MYTRKLKGMSRMVVPVLICVLSIKVIRKQFPISEKTNSSKYCDRQSFKEEVTSGFEVGA